MPLQQDLYNGLSALRTIPFLHGSERKHGNGLAHMDTRAIVAGLWPARLWRRGAVGTKQALG